jgi:hypothetical protein
MFRQIETLTSFWKSKHWLGLDKFGNIDMVSINWNIDVVSINWPNIDMFLTNRNIGIVLINRNIDIVSTNLNIDMVSINRNIDIIFDKSTRDAFGYKICLRAMQNYTRHVYQICIINCISWGRSSRNSVVVTSNIYFTFVLQHSVYFKLLLPNTLVFISEKLNWYFPLKLNDKNTWVDLKKLWPQMFWTFFC